VPVIKLRERNGLFNFKKAKKNHKNNAHGMMKSLSNMLMIKQELMRER
jgi:hypothetical protein